jgi:hypothetical protein
VEIIPPRATFASFPSDFGKWHGERMTMPESELSALQATDYWLGSFQKDSEKPSVSLFTAKGSESGH